MKKITFPQSTNSDQDSNVIETEGVIVVVGANGTGKTRLGNWIEFSSDYADKVHRISAQKSLSMPRTVSPQSMEKAEARLYYGYYNERDTSWLQNPQSYKRNQRWGQMPEIFLLNDFEQLLTYLFSDNYEQVLRYKEESERSAERLEPPVTKLDRVKTIWQYLLPHRELVIRSGSVETKITGDGNHYNAAEMSDGERVIFYLIGEALAAPSDGIIVIDEPELHLHRSIQRKMWDRIERERPDCVFVYLTHDLDFASTRFDSTKVCLNAFDGNEFDWYVVPAGTEMPESVYLEVIGSRSSVLFVEGTDGSHDIQIYQHVYPDLTIQPVGSCEHVISAVTVFNSLSSFHRVRAFGIIDRDYREQSHLAAYEAKGVFAPHVAEVENVLLMEPVLVAVGRQLCLPDPEAKVQEVKTWVISEFERLKKQHALNSASYRLNLALNGFDGRARTIDELRENVGALLADDLSVDTLYQQALDGAEAAIASQDYDTILRLFNHKGLLSQVGKFFGLRPNGYAQKVKDIIRYGDVDILTPIRTQMPTIQLER